MIFLSGDTLICDTVKIAKWQSDPAYQYNKDIRTPDFNVFEWIANKVGKLIRALFNNEFVARHSALLIILAALVILALILFFLYRRRPDLFMKSRKNQFGTAVDEDTIYGVDFERGIRKALAKNDYREAVRLVYLQTLKVLNDTQRIDWQLFKTPTQYTYEVKTPDFREFTLHFLRVRYGGFEASQSLFDRMLQLQTSIEKGGNV